MTLILYILVYQEFLGFAAAASSHQNMEISFCARYLIHNVYNLLDKPNIMVKLLKNHKINTSYQSRTNNSNFGFYHFNNEVPMEVNYREYTCFT